MFFTFSYFWKFLLLLIGSWVFYGFFGYEITMITLLSSLVATNFKNSKHLI